MLDEQSVHKLEGVHPDLVRVVTRAAESKDIAFVVTEGVRSVKRQRELIAAGASTTLRSRHLTGHAVDLAVKVGEEIRWDWPLYTELAEAMKRAARNESVSIEWGGDWRSFKDGPHFQLPWSAYPL
jgi:peptidoglycan LD-endopeptidase CwlK